jgi:hypothetical protein
MERPVVNIVEDVLIFEDGTSRPMTEGEKALYQRGISFVVQPGTGRPTPSVGERKRFCSGCDCEGGCGDR